MTLGREWAAARTWFVVTALAFVLVIAALGLANYSAQRQLRRLLEDDAQAIAGQERLVRWAVEVRQADLEQEVVRLARTEDLKDAVAAGGRAGLRDQLEPPLNRLRKGPLQVTRITLYTPAGVAWLRAHAPEAHGDNVLDRRPLIAEVVKARRIVKGLEMEEGVPCVWAVTPVYRGGRFVGILEAGTPLTAVLQAVQMVTGGEVGVLLPEGSAWAVEPRSAQRITQAAPLLNHDAAHATRQVVVVDEKTYATTLIPLRHYSGQTVAHLAVLSDASAVTEILHKSNAITFAISFLGLVMAAVLSAGGAVEPRVTPAGGGRKPEGS